MSKDVIKVDYDRRRLVKLIELNLINDTSKLKDVISGEVYVQSNKVIGDQLPKT